MIAARVWFVVAATVVPAAAAAQQVAAMRTLAARTSIVIEPRVNIEIDRAAPRHGQVTYGGTVVWLPQIPVVAELAYQTHMLPAGATTFEVDGGWRRRDVISDERVSIVTGGYRTRDSVYTSYVNAATAVRRFDMIRAGFTSLTYSPESGPASPGFTALYAGVSRNTLINTSPSMTAVRVLQRTGVDLLLGSAPGGELRRRNGRRPRLRQSRRRRHPRVERGGRVTPRLRYLRPRQHGPVPHAHRHAAIVGSGKDDV